MVVIKAIGFIVSTTLIATVCTIVLSCFIEKILKKKHQRDLDYIISTLNLLKLDAIEVEDKGYAFGVKVDNHREHSIGFNPYEWYEIKINEEVVKKFHVLSGLFVSFRVDEYSRDRSNEEIDKIIRKAISISKKLRTEYFKSKENLKEYTNSFYKK